MDKIFKAYSYINILSIDVMAGACICSLFIAEFLGVHLNAETVVLLGVSVWLIYTFDHLHDAKNIPHEASTSRHRFHQKHFSTLTWICVAGFAFAAYLLFNIPVVTVVWGAGLSCFVLSYFLLLYLLKLKSSYHKEVMIAILYAAGIMLAPLSIYNGHVDGRVIIIFLQFVLLAFTNLLTFAVYEVATDERDRSPSLVRIIGGHQAIILLKILVVIQFLLATYLLCLPAFFELEVILNLMIMLMGCIVFINRYFAQAELYRMFGDMIFVFPVVGLCFL